MTKSPKFIDSFDCVGRKSTVFGVLILLGVLILAPSVSAAQGGIISGTIYNSNGYPLGDANVKLYNYIHVDTPFVISPLQSQDLMQTQRMWDCPTGYDTILLGIPASSPIFADSFAQTTRPSGLATTNNYHWLDSYLQ